MSITLNDSIEFMINRRLSIEQCYMELILWPENVQEEGKKILHEKMKEGRFDKAIKYHNTIILPSKNPKLVTIISPRYSPVVKTPWYKRIFNFKNK